MKKIYLLFFLIFIFPFPSMSPAQENTITLSGFIADRITGEALLGSNILLYKDSISAETSPFRGAASNNYGYYAIPKLEPGEYILIARHIGYKAHAEKIIVGTNHIQLDIKLTSEEIELGEVVVSDKQSEETSISTISISPQLLEKLPSFTGEVELFKSLQFLPGVKTASETSSGLYVRGGSPDQTLVLVDGMILYNPAHLGNFSSTFNSDAIQSVTLIKGAFPAKYGGRLSSVLDVKLRTGTKERNKGIIGIGTLSSRIMLEGPINEKATYMISGRTMYYDFIQKNILDNTTIPLYNFHDLNLKMTYNLTDADMLSIEGFLSNDDLYNNSDENEIGYDIEWRNRAVNLHWLKISSKSIFLNNSISYVDYKFRSILEDNTSGSSVSDYFSSSILRDIFFKSNAKIHFRDNHVVIMGAELAVHDYNLIYYDYYDEMIEDYLNSEQGIVTAEAAFYIENRWKVFSRLQTNVGGRVYYFKDQDYFRLEPRVSMTYLLSDNIHVNAAFAVAHQFLHLIVRNDISLPTDLWYPSSENVKPSRSAQYVLGFDSYFKDSEYRFSVEGYYKDMKNLYEFENDASIQSGEDIEEALTSGEGEAYGVEFFLNKTKGKFSGWIGYTLSWTRRQFDELNNGKIFYPRYDRRNDISLVAAYDITDNFTIGATWTYATGQGYTVPTGKYQFTGFGVNRSTTTQIDYTARNAFRLPDYHKLDLSAKYKFNWINHMFEAYLNFYNVYNRQNPFAYYITNEDNKTVMKQMTLFPFIPTIGFNVKF